MAGYKIYQRELPSSNYGQPIFSGLPSNPSAPSHTVTNLVDGSSYGFIITAFDIFGNESLPSTEKQISINSSNVPPPSGSPIQLNFQPGNASVPTGYLKDDGSVYTSSRGYGWDTNRTSFTRDRNANTDQRLDTLAFTSPNSTAVWRYDLPNGDYLISLASGDPAFTHGPQRVKVEGQLVFNDLTSTQNSFLTVTDLPVTVTDGALTITLGGSTGYTLLNYVHITPAAPPTYTLSATIQGNGSGQVFTTPSGLNCSIDTCTSNFPSNTSITLTANPNTGSTFTGWSGACTGTSPTCSILLSAQKSVTATFSTPTSPPSSGSPIQLNFQPGNASVPTGYLKDDGSAYTSSRGYGWDANRTSFTRDRNANTDQRLDTLAFTSPNSTAVWRYDLPNGDYLISLASGDPAFTHGPQRVKVEGQLVFNDLTSTQNSFLTVTDLPVTVTDGALTITLGGSTGYTLLNYVHITPAASTSPPSSGSSIQLNFQPGNASVPTGYLKDDGSAYTSSRGYGWDTNRTSFTRDRNANTDQRLDTLAFTSPNSTAVWRYDLPNGDYLISLASGDPAFTHGPQRVKVEGQLVFNDLTSTQNSFLTVTDLPVTVTDGALTITLGGSTGYTLLNYVHITPAASTSPPSSGSSIQLNFQPGNASVPTGYLKDDGSAYTSSRGYGWDANRTSFTRDRNANTDQRLDTLAFTSPNSTAVWRYDLPNGDYLISLASGDPAFTHGPQRVKVEGQLVFNDLTSTQNSFLTVTDLPVTVTDGALTITLGGSTGYTLLNYVHITPAASTSPPSSGSSIQLNFQPGNASVPTGYLKDDGSAYTSSRGYGWDANRTSFTRDRNANTDQRLDTLAFTSPNSTAVWRYDLPNGDYLISLASGDPAFTHGPQRVKVEGQLVFNDLTSTKNSFLTVTDLPVTVTDGALTITLGGSTGYSLLNYIHIINSP